MKLRWRAWFILIPLCAALAMEGRARVPWTASRIVGSPDPPPPYKLVRVFPKLAFKQAVVMIQAPGADRWYLAELGGRIFTFAGDPATEEYELWIDLAKESAFCKPNATYKGLHQFYGLVFHPRFPQVPYCYACYALEARDGKLKPDAERLVRFTVKPGDPPEIDPRSETVLLTWPTNPGGHNGGCLVFGPDGYLYVSMGDGDAPSPPDSLNTGQNLDDLLSTIFRIDVDRTENGKPYAVPKDNPFINEPNARPEIWAYGFRNPWKMTFDRATGDLWVGDVGWEMWEMVYRVVKGGNYGWSIKEGRQWVKPNGQVGPTPIRPPTLEFPHSEAASITGGYVYHGKKFPELVGHYICGDWMTRKVWATKFKGDTIVSHREIAQGSIKIIAFAEDHAGELYLLDYDDGLGGIWQLVPQAAPAATTTFPRKLSETGVFTDTAKLQPAPGVYPYHIRAQRWADHAQAERWLALPGSSAIQVYATPQALPGTAFYSARLHFPKDGVVAKTYYLEIEQGSPATRRKIETQILHFGGEAGDDWRGYSYRWNEAQTDADLVGPGGDLQTFEIKDADAPGQRRRQVWRFPSRNECRQCHNPWSGYVLGLIPEQLAVGAQLTDFRAAGLLQPRDARGQPLPAKQDWNVAMPLADPSDPQASLTARARAYLHTNCAHCHQFGAGGTTQLDVRFDLPLDQMHAVGKPPVQGSFGIDPAALIAPGDPYRSVLWYRIAKLGAGRMPHLGSDQVDRAGVRLLHDWIASLPHNNDPGIEAPDFAAWLAMPRSGPALEKWLATTRDALRLLHAVDQNQLTGTAREQVLAAAMAKDATIRDLFERFIPDAQRLQRLGTAIHPDFILAMSGDAARGRAVFFQATLQCANCHKVNGEGHDLGPDLSKIGAKHDRARLLENLLEPSKVIEPAYVTYLIQTATGQLHQGLLVQRTDREVILRDAQAREIRISTHQIDRMEAGKKSLMPDQLLRDLTAQQAADLLAFLASLK
jgi:putative heme-binding domain-containing protein